MSPVPVIKKRPQNDMSPNSASPHSDLLAGYKPILSKHVPRGTEGNRTLSIVYSASGKRVEIAECILTSIQADKSVKVGITDKGVLIGMQLPNNDNDFPIKKSGKFGIVYNAELSRELAQKFGIAGRTTTSGFEVKYLELGGTTVAFVPLGQNDSENTETEANAEIPYAGSDGEEADGGELFAAALASDPEEAATYLAAGSTQEVGRDAAVDTHSEGPLGR